MQQPFVVREWAARERAITPTERLEAIIKSFGKKTHDVLPAEVNIHDGLQQGRTRRIPRRERH